MNRETFTSIGLLLLRVGFGCFMMVHGVQKIMNYSDMVETFADPLGMGSQLSLIATIGSEVGCSLLLILGLGTRLAAIPLAFTMGVALFVVNADAEWQAKELAAVYLAVYAAIIFTGPGRFSLDRLLLKRWSGKK